MDTAGRVEKFQKRYGLKPKPEEAPAPETSKEAVASATPKESKPDKP
jgi:hypothetical protein